VISLEGGDQWERECKFYFFEKFAATKTLTGAVAEQSRIASFEHTITEVNLTKKEKRSLDGRSGPMLKPRTGFGCHFRDA